MSNALRTKPAKERVTRTRTTPGGQVLATGVLVNA
jgi:hypothetical protein